MSNIYKSWTRDMLKLDSQRSWGDWFRHLTDSCIPKAALWKCGFFVHGKTQKQADYVWEMVSTWKQWYVSNV